MAEVSLKHIALETLNESPTGNPVRLNHVVFEVETTPIPPIKLNHVSFEAEMAFIPPIRLNHVLFKAEIASVPTIRFRYVELRTAQKIPTRMFTIFQ